MVGLDLVHYDVGDFFYDTFAHPHRLFLQLPFAGLTELTDFPLHVLDVGDLIVALLCFLCFGIGT